MPASQLSTEITEKCLEMISKWRVMPDPSPSCPVCDKRDLQVTDHSVRPHTEWYRLVCKDCGLDHFVTLPLGSSSFRNES